MSAFVYILAVKCFLISKIRLSSEVDLTALSGMQYNDKSTPTYLAQYTLFLSYLLSIFINYSVVLIYQNSGGHFCFVIGSSSILYSFIRGMYLKIILIKCSDLYEIFDAKYILKYFYKLSLTLQLEMFSYLSIKSKGIISTSGNIKTFSFLLNVLVYFLLIFKLSYNLLFILSIVWYCFVLSVFLTYVFLSIFSY